MSFSFIVQYQENLKIDPLATKMSDPISSLFDHVKKFLPPQKNIHFNLMIKTNGIKLENNNQLVAEYNQNSNNYQVIVETVYKLNCSKCEIELYIDDLFIQQFSESKESSFKKVIIELEQNLGLTFPMNQLYDWNKQEICNFDVTKKISEYCQSYGEPLILRLQTKQLIQQQVQDNQQKVILKKFKLKILFRDQKIEYESIGTPYLKGSFKKCNAKTKITIEQQITLQFNKIFNIQYAELQNGFAILWDNNCLSILKVNEQ